MFKTYGPGDIAGDVEFIMNSPATCSLESSDGLSGYQLFTSNLPDKISRKLFILISKEVAQKLIDNSTLQAVRLAYTLEERLAHYLLYKNKNGLSSMEELALVLGTSYRHLSRIFRKLSGQGILVLKNKVVTILKRDKLKDISKVMIDDLK